MSFLDEAVARRRSQVEECKRAARSSVEIIRSSSALTPRGRDFAAALHSGSPAIIAEFKRSSPSAGHFAPSSLTLARNTTSTADLDVAHAAAAY